MMKMVLRRVLAGALCPVLLLTALLGCTSPQSEEETPPEQMRCASIAGAPYRLYLPSDWNLMTDAGMSGGYYSMSDEATVTAVLYEQSSAQTVDQFIQDELLVRLTDTFGGVLAVTEGDPIWNAK